MARILAFAFLFLSTASLVAQTGDVELVVHAGHTAGVLTFDVDEERGLFVTGGWESVRVWRAGRLRQVLPGHYATLTHDGTRIVTATRDFFWFREGAPLRIFDAETFELLRERDLGDGLKSQAAITPDDELLLTCCAGREIRVRRLRDGALVRALTKPPSLPDNAFGSDFKLSGDGRRVAMQMVQGVLVWDVETGKTWPLLPLPNHDGRRFGLSHDGRRVVAGGDGPELRVWDLGEEVTTRRLDGHSERFDHLAVSADGRLAITGSDDRTVRLWDLDRGFELGRRDHKEAVGPVALSASGKLAFYNVGGWHPTQWIWDTETGDRHPFHNPEKVGLELPRFSDDGRVLHAVAATRPTSWDTATGEPLTEAQRKATGKNWRGPVDRLAISADGSTLVAAHRGYLRFWDLRTGAVTTRDGLGFVLAPDGSYLAVGPADGRVELWRLATATIVAELRHEAPIRAVAASPDGALLVTVAADGTLRLWDALGGTLLDHWQSRETTHHRLAMTSDAAYVFAAFGGTRVEVWDRGGGPASVAAILEHVENERMLILALSPSGRYLLSAAVNESAFFSWDLQDGFRRRRLAADSYVKSLGFLGEGRVVATGLKAAVSWDLERGRRHQVFEGHPMKLRTLAVRGDGRRLLTGSDDTTARLWDAETGAELRILDGHASAVTAVAWSPAGDFVATGDGDGTIHLWDARTTQPTPPIVRLYSGTRREWAVLGEDGRWDAAEGGHIDGVTVWDNEMPRPLSRFRRGHTPGLLGEVLAERVAHNRGAAPPPVVKTELEPGQTPSPEAVSELALVGLLPSSGCFTGMAYRRPYAYLARADFLLVADLGDPLQPKRVSGLRLPLSATRTVALHKGFAYVSGVHLDSKVAVVIVDVRDPEAPRLERTLEQGDGGSWSLAVSDGILFVADSDLWIYDLGRPEEPTLLRRHSLESGTASGLAVAGGLAYVGKGNDPGLDIVDVRDPQAPRRLATFPTRSTVYEVAVHRTRAVLLTHGDVLLLDVSDPRRPVETARLSSPAVRAVALRDESLVLADGLLGFQRFDLSDPGKPWLAGRLVPPTKRKCGGGLAWTGEHWAVTLGEDLAVIAPAAAHSEKE